MPESVYPGKEQNEAHDHTELVTVLKSILDGMLAKKVVSEKWPEVVSAILDVYLGPVPENFQVSTQTLTPTSYAGSLNLSMEDYVNITSFTHHPFYEKFVLEIPDNHANGSYYNVTLEDLLRIAKNAVEKGFTVAWDGDVSEPGFSAEQGIAIMPATPAREDKFTRPGPEASILVRDRQAQFENFTTTDDHLMHITGTAYDQNGTKYFLVKNSWGVFGAYDGYLYMSESYFRAKTISILVHKDAIPAEIASRITF
jgi:bleomycin hydrolase